MQFGLEAAQADPTQQLAVFHHGRRSAAASDALGRTDANVVARALVSALATEQSQQAVGTCVAAGFAAADDEDVAI
jgi:hypothetical protein